MKVHQFLDHYGVTENPFAEEDAQSDRVFQTHCMNGVHHAAWDKIYGNPATPATSVVFGEQGAGKTALRLQITHKLAEYNTQNPTSRAFVLEYDDFNPFLDCFRERLSGSRRKPEKALQNWRLWDHMDAILTLAVTRLADIIRNNGNDARDSSARVTPESLDQLTRPQKRDLLLLAAIYDHNRDLAARTRWKQLQSKLRFSSWGRCLVLLYSALASAAVAGIGYWWGQGWSGLANKWVLALLVGCWLPFAWYQLRLLWNAWKIKRQVRIVDHETSTLRATLAKFNPSEFVGQPLPRASRGDDRYEMIIKLQAVLRTLGFTSMVVLVDRVDEPHLINGAPERMRDLIWPLFDNKFLKHPGLAFKLLLPAAVSSYLSKEEKEFYERSRLDKQNLIRDLSWSGQALFDIVNDRIRACAKLSEKPVSVRDFFASTITDPELISIFDRLRAPRHLFKFMYRVVVEHCSKYTDDKPVWQIQPETLQSSLALFLRDLEAIDRKTGIG
ncbi:MAG: hypothetical protein DWH91_05770 [Planctomycetota bacterium]|nr:MAG: hypothetical protein DWH91_05770 [Planctomycetota bacterium]